MSRAAMCAAILLAAGLLVSGVRAQSTAADLLILGGRVLDGTGNPEMRADVAITADRISFVGNARVARITAKDTVDARNLVVAPGFWDAHSHADFTNSHGRKALPLLYQGVTTIVLGVDGDGTNEIASIFEGYRRDGIAVNAQGAVGFSTGLFYSPGYFAKTEEVIELNRVAAEFGGSYDTHDRDRLPSVA
jgi:N-acyl-D-amino-acid deacylase